MNILFFLTPKSEVAYIHDDESLRQVLEKMEYHKYSAVPIISRQEARRILITNVPRRSDNTPVSIDSNMEDLLDKAMKQNFVPVLDDKKSFIGIVTRKDIMKYFADKMKKTE